MILAEGGSTEYVQMQESKNYVKLIKLTKIDDHCCMQFL